MSEEIKISDEARECATLGVSRWDTGIGMIDAVAIEIQLLTNRSTSELEALKKQITEKDQRIEELEDAVHKLNSYDAPAEVVDLRAQNQQLLEDKSRLDWLETTGRCAKFSDGWNVWTATSAQNSIHKTSLRFAIDQALAMQTEKPT